MGWVQSEYQPFEKILYILTYFACYRAAPLLVPCEVQHRVNTAGQTLTGPRVRPENAVAVVSILLPSSYEGGKLTFSHEGRSKSMNYADDLVHGRDYWRVSTFTLLQRDLYQIWPVSQQKRLTYSAADEIRWRGIGKGAQVVGVWPIQEGFPSQTILCSGTPSRIPKIWPGGMHGHCPILYLWRESSVLV